MLHWIHRMENRTVYACSEIFNFCKIKERFEDFWHLQFVTRFKSGKKLTY